MFSKSSLVLLLLGVASCYAGLREHIGFKANVSGSDITAKKWQFRHTTFKEWQGPYNMGGAYESGSVTHPVKGRENVDIIYGACSFPISPLNRYPPRTFVASFTGSGTWNSLDNYTQGDVTESRGFIGAAYFGLSEYDVNGNVVANYSFNDQHMNWTLTDMGTDSTTLLDWMTFSGQPTNADWSTSFTFVVSAVAGVINMGNATVTPVSIESIVNITGWPYQSTANSLALNMLVATGQATISNGQLSSGNQDDGTQVTFGLSNTVYADGSIENVVISAYTPGSLSSIIDKSFVEQITARYGSDYSVNMVHVTFPAGANNIMYDPTVGASTDVTNNGVRNVGCVSLLVIFIALLL